jgi:hypothetical protein
VGPSGALECTRGARPCCCLHATRSSGRDVLTAGPIRHAGSPAGPMNRRVGLLLAPVAYGGAVAVANVRAVPDAAPAPGDDVVLGGRSQPALTLT